MTIYKGPSIYRRNFIASAAGAAFVMPASSLADDMLGSMSNDGNVWARGRRQVSPQRLRNVRVLEGTHIPSREIDTEIVLAIDGSGSTLEGPNSNLDIQLEGTAQAFESDDVIEKIIMRRGIGATVVLFGSVAIQTVPWTFIRNKEDSFKFAGILRGSGRKANVGPDTGIIHGLFAANDLFAGSPFDGRKHVLDMSGDGIGTVLSELERVASNMLTKKFGVLANGIVVPSPEEEDVVGHYKKNVITDWRVAREMGIVPGRLWEVSVRADFPEIFREKLKEELFGWQMPHHMPYTIRAPG